MARAPNPQDIREAPMNPSMNPAQINIKVAGSIGTAGRAIGAAIADVGNAFGSIAQREAITRDKQNDARFNLDWAKARSEIYTDIENNAGEDGTGWEAMPTRLQEKYQELDQKYPISGEDRRLRREVDVGHDILRDGQTAAKRRIRMSRDYHQGIEAKEVAGVVQRVQADPSEENYSKLRDQVIALVESGEGTYYTKAMAAERKREVLGALTMARYESLLEKDPETAKALLDDVAKGRYQIEQRPQTQGNRSDYRVLPQAPSASQRRSIRQSGGVVINLDTNWSRRGPTNPMIVIPDDASPAERKAAEAYVRELAGVYRERFGRSVSPRVVTRSQNGRGRAYTMHTEPFAVTDKEAVAYFSSEEGLAQHAQIIGKTLGAIPGAHFAVPHDPKKGDLGAHGSGTNEVELARALISKLQGGTGSVSEAVYRPGQDQAPREIREPYDPNNPPELIQRPWSPTPDQMEAFKRSLEDGTLLNGKLELTQEQQQTLLEAVEDGSILKKLPNNLEPEQVEAIANELGIATREGAGRSMASPQGEQRQAAEPQELPYGLLEGGQVFVANSRKFGQMKFPAEALNAIPRNMLSKLRKRAGEAAMIREREQRAIAGELMSKQLETVMRTGRSHAEWDANVVAEAYRKSPKTLIQFNNRLQAMKELHDTIGDRANLPSDALQDRLDALEMRIIDEEGADPAIARAYRKARIEVERTLRERDRDPARAVNGSREVQEVVKSLADGKVKTRQDVFALVDARLKAQTRLGLPHTPITKVEANDLLAPVVAAVGSEKRKVAEDLVARVKKVYGPHAELVLQSAARLSSQERADDRDEIDRSLRRAERLEKKQQEPDKEVPGAEKPAPEGRSWWPFSSSERSQDTTGQIDDVIEGKRQGRLQSDRPSATRNRYDQFD